jgi:aminoglycoside phosphotransferase (APT) family kinase protein
VNADLIEGLRTRGFDVSPERFAIQRPDQTTLAVSSKDGAQLVAKQLPRERAEKLFRNMLAVWNSTFGVARTPAGLPRPLTLELMTETSSEYAVVLMERVEGRPLAEAQADKFFPEAIALIAALHSSNAVAETERKSRSIVRSLQRKAEVITARAPQFAGVVRSAVAAIELHRRKESELVPSHGDFSPRNVLGGNGRLTLIDWERFQMADPARDVAYFATWPWTDQLKRGRMPDEAPIKRAIELYEQARPGASLRKQIRFYVAAGLIRRAASLVELWPEQSYLVPALAKTALRQFE